MLSFKLRFTALLVVLAACAQSQPARPEADEPKGDSLRFAVVGDTGTGAEPAREVAARLYEAYGRTPFKFVIMLGDNLYGSESPKDYEKKFERPFKPLLEAGVNFYASLGNHDDPTQTHYKLFNMDGKRYYSFKPAKDVRFFALDTNQMDAAQLRWLEKELDGSGERWKIAFFHHPLYSSGARHGPDLEVRKVLEPLFIRYGVSVVFSGHEHIYERIKPQHGIHYFIVGSSAKLRRGGIEKSDITAAANAEDRAFLVAEISGGEMRFETVARNGQIIDQGAIPRRSMAAAAK